MESYKEIMMSFLSIAVELTFWFFAISILIQVVKQMLPTQRLVPYLQKGNAAVGAGFALVLAFITPFCSCSTIPIIVNLLQERTRFAVVMVFLFASPVLDLTIVTLMAVLMGVKVALAYTLITAAFALLVGFSLEKLGFESAVKKVVLKSYEEKESRFSWRTVWKETFSLLKTVYPYLLIGAALGSIIHGFVPTDWISTYLGGEQWWLIPIAAVIGIPLYIRLSTMIPISHIMIVKGMAMGPVMAMMISSAGASLPELALLQSVFHKRLMVAFVASVFLMASLSGFLFYWV